MDEYFISYYGCESKTKKDTGRKCKKCSNVCEQKKLLYRCRLWDLTDDEVEHFKEKVKETGGFAPVTDSMGSLQNIIGDYVLHSTKDIPIATLRARKEHVQARENFERLRLFDEFGDQAQALRRFQQIACDTRELRYGVVPDSCFTDSKTIALFYQLEVAIIKNAGNEKIRAVRQEKKKLAKEKAKLEREIARLEKEESALKDGFGSWIKSQKQELEAIRPTESNTVTEQAGSADSVDESKGRWVSQAEFLELQNIERRSLTTYRSKGRKSKDGLSGTDSQGNHWRKKGTLQNEQAEYFVMND